MSWNSVTSSFSGEKQKEMVSREESPKWKNRRAMVESNVKECDKLPTWDVLEATLDKKLLGWTEKLTQTADEDEHTDGLLLTSGNKN